MRRMRWMRLAASCAAAALILCLLPFSFAEEAEDAPPARLRALLVGCDRFLTQPDTWPSAENNVRMLSDALLTDNRRYALIRSYSSSLSAVEDFEEAVMNAFQGAEKGDISLLYLASHGVILEDTAGTEAAFLLSDGRREALLDADTLERLMDRIPGKKILILDGCYAGAMIGKGMPERPAAVHFTGPDYKVLCSAGGSEASWYWQGAEDDAASGASYFATVLAYGLGMGGEPTADRNRDGTITLGEMNVYLCENYAASTPWIYPMGDADFPLFMYDKNRPQPLTRAVTDITFEDTLLTAGQSDVVFSFTVQRQVQLYYQIVYHQDGVWQFSRAQHYLDGEQMDGSVLPGRKMRTLSLDTGAEDACGYAMLQMITLENGVPVFQGSRLLCVQPAEGEAALSVRTEPAFCPEAGQELPIWVCHDVPCGLTVNILDERGKTVRRLAFESPSRPEQMTPEASSFYWDGRLTDGETAPAGMYRVQVKVRLGNKTAVSESEPFEVKAAPPAAGHAEIWKRGQIRFVLRPTPKDAVRKKR